MTSKVESLQPRIRVSSEVARAWWLKQGARTQIAFAVAMLFAVAGLMNLALSLGRTSTVVRVAAPVATAATLTALPILQAEPAPSDAGKTWSVVRVLAGTGTTETEPFTVRDHWRVDWLFNPGQSGTLQIFIYHADGRLLMQVAADTQRAGADSSFWAGPGRYFLKVNATGGDWKLSVQDLR